MLKEQRIVNKTNTQKVFTNSNKNLLTRIVHNNGEALSSFDNLSTNIT